jgi:ADP-heptose:LPS heptosyltransferase
MRVLVRYGQAWGLGDLLCSDPMMLGLVERYGDGVEIFVEGHAGNVIHNPLVRGAGDASLRPDVVVDVRHFRAMDAAAYGRLEAMDSLVDHMCSYAGVTPSDRRPQLHLTREEADFIAEIGLDAAVRPRVAICADYLDPLRHWPIERWREIAQRLEARGILVLEVGTHTRLGVGADFVAQLSIRQTAAVLAQCDLFLGNNSGLFHYAQAAGCACVTLFSLATPRRFIHDGARVVPVQASELPCIDCMTRKFAAMQTLGCIAAPRGRCVTDVSVQRMWSAVERGLELARRRAANPS